MIAALHDVCKQFIVGKQTIPVLKHISLEIAQGEMVSIMGASGSGKSTLMNILGLLDKPTSGKYELFDKDVVKLSDNERAAIRNHSIGFVFQQFHLLPKLSVFENVALPLYYAGIARREFAAKVGEVLERVGMSDYLHHKPSMLSGGQQQRVAIARALVLKPAFILADEPTGALDSKTSSAVMALLHQLHRDLKATIVIITHDKEIARQCQREIQLKDGEIARELV